jgi:hypothetical protein
MALTRDFGAGADVGPAMLAPATDAPIQIIPPAPRSVSVCDPNRAYLACDLETNIEELFGSEPLDCHVSARNHFRLPHDPARDGVSTSFRCAAPRSFPLWFPRRNCIHFASDGVDHTCNTDSMMVPAQQLEVALQQPFWGDVSSLNPMRSSVLFGMMAETGFQRCQRRGKAMPDLQQKRRY